jgi:cytochrome c biogenesis protein CcmG/thiol:disulfide interchange protein DsbE
MSLSRAEQSRSSRIALLAVIVVIPVLLIAALLLSVRNWSQSPDAPASATLSAAATPLPTSPPAATLVAKTQASLNPAAEAPDTGSIDSNATDSSITASSLASDTVARVNGAALSVTMLTTIQLADAAVARLLGQPSSSEHDSLLDRLINGEIVAQAARADGFTLSEAEVDNALLLWLDTLGRSQPELDQALIAVGFPNAAFHSYFAHLLTVDRFAAQAASRAKLTVPEYLRSLQKNAQVSLGPAAMDLLSTSTPAISPGEGALTSATATPSSTDSPAAPDDTAANAPAEQTASPFVLTTLAGDASAMTPITANIEADPTEARGLEPGQLAPLFDLPLLGDDPAARLTLADLAGKPSVLSFWTTWCPYCRQQTPVLVAAHADRANSNIQWIGVNVQEDGNTVGSYVRENTIPYPIVLDGNGEVAGLYAVNGYPITYFLDAQTRVVGRHLGALTEQTLAGYLLQLNQPAGK